MYLFLLSILGIYSAVHIYAFVRIRAAFPLGAMAGIFLAAFMAAMTVAPVMVRILERQEYETQARLLSHIGYTWMGILFLFFSVSLLIDLYRLVIFTSGLLLHRDMALFIPSARSLFLIPCVIALFISCYGYFEALKIEPERFTVTTAKLPPALDRLRIVQISDVHLGLMVREARLEKIIRVIKQAKPDIVVSTGDLVDGQINSMTGLAAMFGEIDPPHGKYAVTGNHEFYAGLSQALEFTRQAGFTVLRGEAVDVAGALTIAGIDDPTGKRFAPTHGLSEQELLARTSPDHFTILLKHLPLVRGNGNRHYDLQLSGHTHRGQIFPFSLVTALFFHYHAGWYTLPGGAHLHVSRGTGTWGPPIRFLAPPEVTVIDLVREDGSS